MSTYAWGYTYDMGKRVGYDFEITNAGGMGGFLLHFVSSKDKARIVRELKRDGHEEDNIIIHRSTNNWG